MLKNKYALFICAAALMGSALQAHAQRMYRCGNAYQDRPCEGAQPPGKELRDFSGSAAPANRPVADPQCARLGEEAVKIVWARESGATREQQIAANAQNQPLIDSVYYKRGSAPEIRTAIEAECMAEKQRQAAALAAAAAGAQGIPAVPPPSSQGPSANDISRFQQRQDEEIAANQEAFKKTRCADLSRQAENLRRQERAGGSSGAMSRLHELRTNLEATRRREGC